MTFHDDEPEDTPSWVSNTQDWLTDLDRDPDYISYETTQNLISTKPTIRPTPPTTQTWTPATPQRKPAPTTTTTAQMTTLTLSTPIPSRMRSQVMSTNSTQSAPTALTW